MERMSKVANNTLLLNLFDNVLDPINGELHTDAKEKKTHNLSQCIGTIETKEAQQVLWFSQNDPTYQTGY